MHSREGKMDLLGDENSFFVRILIIKNLIFVASLFFGYSAMLSSTLETMCTCSHSLPFPVYCGCFSKSLQVRFPHFYFIRWPWMKTSKTREPGHGLVMKFCSILLLASSSLFVESSRPNELGISTLRDNPMP